MKDKLTNKVAVSPSVPLNCSTARSGKREARQLTIFGIPAVLDESLPEDEIHLDLPDGSTHVIKLNEPIFGYK